MYTIGKNSDNNDSWEKMNDSNDISIAGFDYKITNETDCHHLDSYISQLKDCAVRIRNRETPPPKGQVSGILMAVVLIVISECFFVDSEDGFFFDAFMGTILVRICMTGRATIADFYKEAASALESFRDTGSIPEIEMREECLAYVNCVIEACMEGLGNNTVRTPKQWQKGIRRQSNNHTFKRQ